MQLKPGTLLERGKYRIIESLGRGGFGVTYLAEQVMAKRKVCIKEFFPKDYYVRDEGLESISILSKGHTDLMARFKAKFIKEAQIIAALDHPNIIHIHDIFEENNTAYYAMDYVEGGSLHTLVKSGGVLSEADSIKYIREIASALDYIHERKIMHLDVKPSNVMISKSDSHSVLIDFGLSKHYDEHSGEATSTTPVGVSHGFAPMEQYKQGGVGVFSPETDIYSLGATMFYLLTGCVPPQAADVACDGLPELPAHLSESTRSAITQSMAWNLKARPHTIKEFLALLDGSAPAVAAVNTPSVSMAEATPSQPISEETAVPNAGRDVANDKTESFATQSLKIEPNMWGGSSSTFSNFIHSITLISASLQFIIAYGLIQFFHYNLRLISVDLGYITDVPSKWNIMLYALLSVTLLVAVIRRNNRMAISLSIGSLIAYVLMHSDLPDYDETLLKIGHYGNLLSIIVAGVGSMIGQRISPQERVDVRMRVADYSSTTLLTLLFALIYVISYLYPTWKLDVNSTDNYMAKFAYVIDYSYIDICVLSATIGIIGVACQRYKTSLLAAIFALVLIPVTIFSKFGLEARLDNEYYNYISEQSGIDISVSSYSLSLVAYFPIIIAIAIIGIILGFRLTKQSQDESWRGTIVILPAMLLIYLGWCGNAISSNMWNDYSSFGDSDKDYSLCYSIASMATIIFAVCRQHRATAIFSAIATLLSLIIISQADDIKSGVIVYGIVVSAVTTFVLAARERQSMRYDVVLAVLALVAIYSVRSIILLEPLSYYVTLLIIPISYILLYSLRRNKVVSIFMMLLICAISYIITDEAPEQKNAEYFPDFQKSMLDTNILVCNIATVLLVGAVIYSVSKDYIKKIVSK